MTRGQPRESLNLRVLPELKREVEDFARTIGIPVNAAAVVLLAEGLMAERQRRL